ncbi:MAG: hypothetical protein R6V83_07210 [Candidatus Thorarchaeota archaeon]
MTKHTNISMPKILFEQLEQHIKGTSFNTVSSFMQHVARLVLRGDVEI